MSVATEGSNRSKRFVDMRRAVKDVYGGRLDLTGGVFDRLTVLEYAGRSAMANNSEMSS